MNDNKEFGFNDAGTKPEKDKFEVFKSILENNFDFNDEKVQKIMKDLYTKHGEPMFNSNVYKIYQDILKVNKKSDNGGFKVYNDDPTPRYTDNYPMVNVYESTNRNFVIYDIICPGVNKNQLELTVETDDMEPDVRTFLVIKGTSNYDTTIPPKASFIKFDLEIGSFIKKFDITHYNININDIKSEYKDGVLHISLPKNIETKGQNFKIPIT